MSAVEYIPKLRTEQPLECVKFCRVDGEIERKTFEGDRELCVPRGSLVLPPPRSRCAHASVMHRAFFANERKTSSIFREVLLGDRVIIITFIPAPGGYQTTARR